MSLVGWIRQRSTRAVQWPTSCSDTKFTVCFNCFLPCIEIESNYQPLIVKEILELRATICMVSGVQWRCFSACVIGQSKVHLRSKHLQKQLRKSFKGYWTRIILCTLDSIRLMGTCCFLSFNFFKLQKRLNDTTRSPDSERINN